MPSAHRASARRPTHSGPRAGPLTHAQGRHFRTGVIEALRGMASHKFHGTVRAFATQLMERHGSQPPFESRARIEGRLRRLEREGVIRYDWTKSQAYEVVSTITLVTEDAVEPPRRKFTRRREVASEAEQVRRRMEILATLEHLGGNAESVRELARIVIREYGDGHRSGTVIVDLQSLEHTRSVEKRASRVHGRPTQHIALSGTGRRTLARYRDAHGGVPKPPAPTDIGAAAPAVAVPKSQRVGLSELSLAVLGEVALYSGAGRELAEIITALARVWNHPPKKGFAQT
ncbi:MAG: hypothetical protein Q7R80_03105, partial [bacterium]|nr:hypothetical protein [bacterium]